MAYKLMLAKRAEQQIDQCLDYLVTVLKNPAAATAVIKDIQEVYDLLKQRADMYAFCSDPYLKAKGYRKVLLSRHHYLFLYRIEDRCVLISGFFHGLEDYPHKI